MTMKKILLFMVICTLICGCTKKWEYKVISVNATNATDSIGIDPQSDYYPNVFGDPSSALNDEGKEGWELVTSYTITETSFPNFGDKQYVTGLNSNTKTKKVCFVLKRPLTK